MPSNTIYHYTSASAVNSIIGSNLNTRFYATHSDYLNDHKEISTGITLIKEIILNEPEILSISKQLLRYLELFINFPEEHQFNPGYFITCFSEVTGIVDQWRGYGNSGYGFALGFDFDSLVKFAAENANISFLPCIYNRKLQIAAIVEAARKAKLEYGAYSRSNEYDASNASAMDDLAFASTIVQVSMQIKHKAFKQEKEWRLVAHKNFANENAEFNENEYKNIEFRSSRLGLIPYIELHLPKIKKIVVGPSPDQYGNAKAIKLLLRKLAFNDAKNIAIELEKIPFRE